MLVYSTDSHTSQEIESHLVEAGFGVWIARSRLEAAAVLDRERLDLLIVDVRRAADSAREVLSLVRAQGHLSALALVHESLEASADDLELCADDFMSWPASPRELKARARLRSRASSPLATSVSSGLEIDHANRAIRVGDELRELPPKEFELLAYLASSPGTAFSKEQLLNAVWESLGEWQSSQTVVEHIYRLRRRVERDPSDPQHILTVRGGYVFKG